ncbi:MAG: tRNA lysidine(34) synthetase TilS [Candidatus Omnitrophica bacterium]|nr:tRNA lysidine(34) synthetase TilS [Candidatus Omnitrophota bacterium]
MIQDQFLNTIRKFRMIEKGETVFVAVSGGCDSVTLFHLLLEIRKPWKLRLGILHVNHQLRGLASDRDEAFVRQLAHREKIPFFTTRVRVRQKAKQQKSSLEEAARQLRYQFFEETAKTKGAGKVVLAHTQDDQAETVLMRIITGTGLQGLQAIRPKRKSNDLYFVRPLIETSRDQIRHFAKEHHIRFREDSSNQSLQFLRNRIRLKLIPFIQHSFNPQVKRALARLPHLLDVDLTFLDETAELFYKELAVRRHADEVLFRKQPFLALQPSIQYRLIRRALRILGNADLDFEHWNVFLERLSAKQCFKLQLPKRFLASVSSDAIRIRKNQKTPVAFSCSLDLGESVEIPEIDATLSCELLRRKVKTVRKSDHRFEIFDGSKLIFPLTVRNREPGDRFQPLGQRRPLKLKSYLINRHVPVEERDDLPLVLSEKQIAWVSGVGMSHHFKVEPETKQFVRVALTPRNPI